MHLVRAIVWGRLFIPLLIVTIFGLGMASILYGNTSTELQLSDNHATGNVTSAKQQVVTNDDIVSSNRGQSTPDSVSPSYRAVQPSTSNKTPAHTDAVPPQTAIKADSRTDNSLSVSLYINDQLKSVVRVNAGANQCDVLSSAKQSGAISSLVMKYSETYQTQAVYVIDGIGDSDKVGWVYKINGASLPYGCSKAAVKDGDVVKWKYVN